MSFGKALSSSYTYILCTYELDAGGMTKDAGTSWIALVILLDGRVRMCRQL
jgi:hypothetical protein